MVFLYVVLRIKMKEYPTNANKGQNSCGLLEVSIAIAPLDFRYNRT